MAKTRRHYRRRGGSNGEGSNGEGETVPGTGTGEDVGENQEIANEVQNTLQQATTISQNNTTIASDPLVEEATVNLANAMNASAGKEVVPVPAGTESNVDGGRRRHRTRRRRRQSRQSRRRQSRRQKSRRRR